MSGNPDVSILPSATPVELTSAAADDPQSGMALCLSGGGSAPTGAFEATPRTPESPARSRALSPSRAAPPTRRRASPSFRTPRRSA